MSGRSESEPGESRAVGWRRAAAAGLPWLGFATAAALFAWRRQPANLAAGAFSSDTAIPLLMANAEALTPFHLFYFGQDRFGGWPYILAWIAGRLGGFGWTPELLYGFQALVVFSAAWPIARLGGAWGQLAAAAYLLAVGLDPACLALDVAQPYGWQLATLLWAWWALRRACEEHAGGRRARRPLLVAAGAASLSGWLSPFSYLALLVVAAVEAGRCWVLSAGSARPAARRLALFAATPTLAAMGFGVLVTLGHLAYAYARGLRYQHTAMKLDLGHLGENLVGMSGAVARLAWWPVAPLATLGAGMLAWRLLGQWRAALRTASPGASPAPKAQLGALELEALALAAWLVGTANFALFVLISWARINAYDPRYLTLSQVPWTVAAVAASLSLVLGGARRSAPRARAFAFASCAVAVAAVAGWSALAARASPTFGPVREAARALGASAGTTVLFGDYWGTYLFAGVEPGTHIVPAVAERSFDRLPWETRKLATAERVVVSHWQFPRSGDAQHPAPCLFERDTLLVQAGPYLTSGPYGFSAYDNRTRAAAAGVELRLGGERVGEAATDGKSGTVADLQEWRAGAAPLEIAFPATASGRLLLFFDKPEATALVPVVRLEAVGAATFRGSQGRDVLVFDFDGTVPVERVRLERLDQEGDSPVRLREVFLLPSPGVRRLRAGS